MPRVFAKKADILKLVPGIRSEDLTGAVRIWDYGVDDKALVLAVIASALKAGGVAYEHAEVTHYRLDKSKNLYELRIRREGREEILFARKIVNAAGPWVDKVRRSVDQTVPKFIDAIGGSHIELASFLPESIILRAKDGRIFFVICRGERARVGTTEWPCADPDHVAVPESDIDYLLESLNFYFPEKKFSRRDILSVDAGIRPLFYFGQSRSASQIPREHELRFGPDGVLHVIGVKLTDHRRAAEEAVDMILGAMNLKRKSLTSRTALV